MLLLMAATGAMAQSTPITTVRSWDFTKGGRNSDWESAQEAATSVWGGKDSSFRYSNANNLSGEELTDGTNPLKGLAGIYFTAPAGSLLLGGVNSSTRCLQTNGDGVSILLPDCAAKDRITIRFCASVNNTTVTITSDQMKSSYVANSTDRSNEVSAFVKENGNVVLNVPSKVRIYEIKVEPYVAVTNFNLSAETVTVTENKTVTVTATGFSPSNAFDKTLEWTTADENVATVANGVITGVNPGTTTITVTSVDGPSKTIGVTVLPTYSVTLVEGTEDADKWTVKVGEGEAQAFPVEGLDGGETVTATYSGEKKVKSVKAVKKAPADPLAVPLTIEAITAGSIKVTTPKEGMQYSLDGGKTKNAVTTDDIVLNVGDKVQFYGNGTSITSYGGSSSSESTKITGSGDGFTCKVYGNIMSLVDETGFATATTLSANYTFKSLFSEFTTLTDASGLLLPATQLASYCYQQMFQGCSTLTAAPELPATKQADYCYRQMFQGCTSLTTAPALPATQLANCCYQQMFQGCSALTAAPELPATQAAYSCYFSMFQGCSALTTATALPATQLAERCYQQMFRECINLTAAPALPAETLASRCYYQMFYRCSKLATVTCLATSDIGVSNSTTNWLQSAGTEVQGTKTVYTSSSANWPTGNNGIPGGWTRVDVDN